MRKVDLQAFTDVLVLSETLLYGTATSTSTIAMLYYNLDSLSFFSGKGLFFEITLLTVALINGKYGIENAFRSIDLDACLNIYCSSTTTKDWLN